MNYLLIKNGTIVDEYGISRQDLLVGNNYIMARADSLERPEPDTPVIDARGELILPGSVDIYRHFTDLWSDLYSVPEFHKFTKSLLLSGTSLVFDALEMKSIRPPFFDAVSLLNQSGKNNIDIGFHLTVRHADDFLERELLMNSITYGISSFIIPVPFPYSITLDLIEARMKSMAELGLLFIFDFQSTFEFFEVQGPSSFGNSPLIWLQKLIALVSKTHCRALFLNIYFQEELDLIIDAIHNGLSIYCEIPLPCLISEKKQLPADKLTPRDAHGYHLITLNQFVKHIVDPHFIVGRPPFYLGIDEIENVSLAANRPDRYFMMKNFLSLAFSALVKQSGFSINDFIEIISSRPARLMGVYPRKGNLNPGALADFLIFDPDDERNIFYTSTQESERNVQLLPLSGLVKFLFVGGNMIFDGENFFLDKLHGKYIYRSNTVH